MALRVGVLGAADIVPTSLVGPARGAEGIEIAAVAARDEARAARFAQRHGIPRWHGGKDAYRILVEDPDVDAVYIPLPNALHGQWTIRAIRAGKHVLTEKPWTANADEAEEVAAVAARHPELVVMEAFHDRYHPLTERILQVIDDGAIGELRRLSVTMCVPMPPSARNIRWNLALGGGGLMDLGCYAVHQARTIARAEPRVLAAEARQRGHYPGIDSRVHAELAFPGDVEGEITTGIWTLPVFSLRADATGSRGSLTVTRLLSPQSFARLRVRTPTRSWSEGTTRRSSYLFQLEAFRDAVAGDRSRILTGPDDSVANMRVIDAIYTAADMEVRRPLAG